MAKKPPDGCLSNFRLGSVNFSTSFGMMIPNNESESATFVHIVSSPWHFVVAARQPCRFMIYRGLLTTSLYWRWSQSMRFYEAGNPVWTNHRIPILLLESSHDIPRSTGGQLWNARTDAVSAPFLRVMGRWFGSRNHQDRMASDLRSWFTLWKIELSFLARHIYFLLFLMAKSSPHHL